MQMCTFTSEFLVEDVWLDILQFLEPSEILVVRQVCHALYLMTCLKPVWITKLHSAIIQGECPSPGSVDYVASLSSQELERLFLRSLAVERQISRREGRGVVLPLCTTVDAGRPKSYITWSRMLRGGRVLQSTSDGFLRCLSFSSKDHHAELLGAWSGLGALTSGEVIYEGRFEGILAVATDFNSSILRIIRLEFGPCNSPHVEGVDLKLSFSRLGPSGVFACSSKAVFSAFYEGRNYVHALILSSDLVVRLGVEQAPQTVLCGVATEVLLLIVKDSVLELYSIEDICQADSMFQQVLALQRFEFTHHIWKAVATHFPDFAGLCSYGTFGIVVRWHDGITLYTVSTISDAVNARRDFVLENRSHLSVQWSIGALSMGRAGYRVVWIECTDRPGLSRLVTSRLTSVPSLDGTATKGLRSYVLTKPRCLWTGAPSGILDHCSFCSMDEASGLYLVAQTYSGVIWSLTYCSQHVHIVPECGATTLSVPCNTLLADQLSNIVRGTFNPQSVQKAASTPLLGPVNDPVMIAEITKNWYTIPKELLHLSYTNDWTRTYHRWTNSRGSLRDLVRTVFHLPGTPKLIMEDEGIGETLFEVDGYFYYLCVNAETWWLGRAVGCSDVFDFINRLKERRVTFEGTPCEACSLDSDAISANNRWDHDHNRLVGALKTRPRPKAPRQQQDFDTVIASLEFRTGEEAARRLVLSVDPGILRRRVGMFLFEEDSLGRRTLHACAAAMNITVDAVHDC